MMKQNHTGILYVVDDVAFCFQYCVTFPLNHHFSSLKKPPVTVHPAVMKTISSILETFPSIRIHCLFSSLQFDNRKVQQIIKYSYWISLYVKYRSNLQISSEYEAKGRKNVMNTTVDQRNATDRQSRAKERSSFYPISCVVFSVKMQLCPGSAWTSIGLTCPRVSLLQIMQLVVRIPLVIRLHLLRCLCYSGVPLSFPR